MTAAVPAFTLTASGLMPKLAKNENGFALTLELQGMKVVLEMDEMQVHSLGLMCLHHFPFIEPRIVAPTEEDAFRFPARSIGELEDRSMQLLLREVQSESLIDFLWYMKDAELAKRVFRNMSQRAAEMLYDDLERRYGRVNPDTASVARVEQARASTLEIVAIYNRLADEGQIERV